jgi:hypothetical protein
VPHNADFLAAATAMEGRSTATILAMRATQAGVGIEMLRQMPGFDLFLARPAWTLLRFGRWSEVLAEPQPPEGFPFAQATVHAARGLALLGQGKVAEAEAERAAMQEAAAKVAPEAPEGLNLASTLLAIGGNLLGGELALARGDAAAGLPMLAAAVAAEDGLRYNEPSDWPLSAEAAAVAARLERAWAEADLGLDRLAAPPAVPSR